MKKTDFLITFFFATALSAMAMAQPATGKKSVELFGAKLKGTDRHQLRTAFAKGGLRPVRVEDGYWYDQYNAAGTLEGASTFSVGYVHKTNAFAEGTYTFNAFMDTGLVTKVANMVSQKYGPPSSRSGRPDLGEVTYRWHLPDKMVITVSRGWPDTTTYLKFSDPAAESQMRTEIAVQDQAREREKAKAQAHAF